MEPGAAGAYEKEWSLCLMAETAGYGSQQKIKRNGKQLDMGREVQIRLGNYLQLIMILSPHILAQKYKSGKWDSSPDHGCKGAACLDHGSQNDYGNESPLAAMYLTYPERIVPMMKECWN